MRKLMTLLSVALFATVSVFAQGVVKGKVTDENGQPLSGASVVIKGTTTGVSTGSDGAFSINVSSSKTVLEVSAVNFVTKSVNVGAGEMVSVSLTSDTRALEEVIVTGVAGATSKKKMTVSVTKVTASQLNVVPATSVSSALTGKVAGLKTSSNSGNPGQPTDILLRGDNNLNTSSAPLLLIDGVITTGNISDINVDDVESIEVVKGAAASALYGSRAGNGVISVITKRGKGLGTNKTQIIIRNEIGLQDLSHYLETSTAHPYALASDWETAKGKYTKYAGVTYPSDYIGAGYDPGIAGNRAIDADHYMDNPYGVFRNQQDEFFRTGLSYTNVISVANQTEKNNIYLSFENNKQEGVVKLTDGYQRQNFRFNMDQQVYSWLRFSVSNLFVNRVTNTPGYSSGLFYNIARQERDVDLKNKLNPDGTPYYLRVNNFNQETTNPLYPLSKQKWGDKSRRWLANYTANIKFTRWADLDVTQTVEITNYRSSNITPKDYYVVSNLSSTGVTYNNGSMSQSTSESNTKNTQLTLNLSHKFGGLTARGKLSYLYENRHYESNGLSSSQFKISGIENFDNFASINSGTSYIENEKAQNYFAILNLDWHDKFLFDGMFRYDGSSLFGPDARWNPYYRVSGAYRISQDFKINGIDELKVRAAYGTAGIRPGFDWQYEVYSLSNGVATASQKGNKNLKPSTTAETEVGLNVDFLKKFSFEATYASSETRDQFLNVPLIPFLNDGFSSQWQNAGTVKSNTLEFTLAANWVKAKNFSWTTNLVFGRVRQKITELPIAPYSTGGLNGDQGDIFRIQQGETYGAIYGRKFVRTLDEMAQQLPTGKTIADYEVNSEGYVIAVGTQGTPNELPILKKDTDGSTWFGKIGDGNSDFNMGITNTFTWKSLLFYFLLDWKQGGDIYNGKEQRLAFNLVSKKQDMSGVPDAQKKAYDYWSTGMYDANFTNAYWVEKGTYLKVREVALGYNIPSKYLGGFLKGTFKGVSAKVIGRNLLTLTNYSGYDPEVGSLRQPIDGIYANPIYRSFAFSLELKF